MRFKVDENLHPEVADVLRQSGHDALTVYEQGLRGHADGEVAGVCQKEDRAILTLDLDPCLSRLCIQYHLSSGGPRLHRPVRGYSGDHHQRRDVDRGVRPRMRGVRSPSGEPAEAGTAAATTEAPRVGRSRMSLAAPSPGKPVGELATEPRDFEDKLRRAANLRLEPDLNDGVVLDITPPHELVSGKIARGGFGSELWPWLMRIHHESNGGIPRGNGGAPH